ncbi:MAG: hypothetical protein HC781_15250 [Leptolyngbyaceae cyanobacterium CSU_1_4]|nr:hypothetical protein [Leptolyngbyaceae cyanobacterium CSU_1_4]
MSFPLPSPASQAPSPEPFQPRVFRLSPLIRITLLLFYVSLTVPLPFLAKVTQAAVPPQGLAIGLILGGVALYAALCERVMVNEQGIQVAYPAWVPPRFRKGWSLPWAEVKALKPRSTGQGGIVYYLLSTSDQAYLLPMRIAGFAQFVRQVQAKTGLDTTDVRPLAQPWMYLFLLVLTVFLLAIDTWTLCMAWGWTA